MQPTVVIANAVLHDDAVAALRRHCTVIRCTSNVESERVTRETGARAAIVGASWKITGEVLDRLPQLWVVGRPGIGVDNVDLAAATARGVAVVNTPDGPSISTAEHAVSLLLALAKRHRPAARLLATGVRYTTEPRLTEVAGKVLGLVGLGRIGGRVARICGAGLDMRVIAYDPWVSAERARALGVTVYPTLADVLREADFVSLHLPLTDDTRGLIDGEALRLMKPSAYLINCARGPIVDEPALLAALQGGTLAGAGLDVFEVEPPLPSNPLLALESVVATPHTAGYTEDAVQAIGEALVAEILDVLRGARPDNLVNPAVWESAARRQRWVGVE